MSLSKVCTDLTGVADLPSARVAPSSLDNFAAIIDSGSAFTGVPSKFLSRSPDTDVRVGEMSGPNTIPMSSKRNNGVADIMALPDKSGDDICFSKDHIGEVRNA